MHELDCNTEVRWLWSLVDRGCFVNMTLEPYLKQVAEVILFSYDNPIQLVLLPGDRYPAAL